MPDLTLDQVKSANLPATVDAIGKHGGAYVVAYLPDNPRKERFRSSRDASYRNTSRGLIAFGPGGEFTPQDGWQHIPGCDCRYCK